MKTTKVYCLKDYGIRHFLHPLTPSVRNEWVLESWKDYRGYKKTEQDSIDEREKAKLIKPTYT